MPSFFSGITRYYVTIILKTCQKKYTVETVNGAQMLPPGEMIPEIFLNQERWTPLSISNSSEFPLDQNTDCIDVGYHDL